MSADCLTETFTLARKRAMEQSAASPTGSQIVSIAVDEKLARVRAGRGGAPAPRVPSLTLLIYKQFNNVSSANVLTTGIEIPVSRCGENK